MHSFYNLYRLFEIRMCVFSERVHIVALAYQHQMDVYEDIHFDVPEFDDDEEVGDDEELNGWKACLRARRARRKERRDEAIAAGTVKVTI